MRRARPLVSLLAFAVLGVLIAAGFFGSRDPLSNPLPLVVWTLLWVGLTLVQGILGNLWSWINPWFGPSWIAQRLGLPPRLLRLPERIGYWPAVVQFAGFAWFELIDPAPDDPARLALVVLAYAALNLAATLIFGYRDWSRRGEFLSVFFGMIASFAILQRCRDKPAFICARLPGAKLSEAEPLPPSGVAFLLLALSSVSFDGLSRTFFWLGLNGVNPLEFPGRSAMIAINTSGLAAAFVALAAVFVLAVAAGERLTAAPASVERSGWPLCLVARADRARLPFRALSDRAAGQRPVRHGCSFGPVRPGWNLFGTAYMTVSAGIASGSAAAWVLWNAQAAAIIGGHVLAVLVAHMLADRRRCRRPASLAWPIAADHTDDSLHRARALAALHTDRRMSVGMPNEQLLPAPGIGDLVCIQAIFPQS